MSRLDSFFIDQLKYEAISLWEKSPVLNHWAPLRPYTYWEKRQNEKYIEQMSDHLFKHLEAYPAGSLFNKENQRHIIEFIRPYILGIPFLNEQEKTYMTSDAQMEATLMFIERYQELDPSLSYEDLSQALRNFWVGTLLQTLFKTKITCSDSLYAYSMLYPYTDNLIDQPDLTNEEKHNFCTKLTQVLMGGQVETHHAIEERIFQLVQMIYEEYPIEAYPSVQEGLLSIHKAQIQSLKQHNDCLLPYEMDLLGQTFFKGGTSLLADGLLVNPHLDHEAIRFCFSFGAALQLCDDLQDLETDALENHHTLFSQLKDKYVLDSLLIRLNGFLASLEGQMLSLVNEDSKYLIDLILGNTRLILIYAAFQHECCFKREFINSLEPYMPIRPKVLKKLSRKFKRRFQMLNLKEQPQLSQNAL